MSGPDRLDLLDRQIIRLIQQRIEVSRSVRTARLAAGGHSIEMSRENQIIDRYGQALGFPGIDLAVALVAQGC